MLLLDEPTRGVDVGARSEIYALIRSLADSGVAVVVVSSEMEEVLGLADRVLVIREGRVVHAGPADEIDEHRVLDLVHGRKCGLMSQHETAPVAAGTRAGNAPPAQEPLSGSGARGRVESSAG